MKKFKFKWYGAKNRNPVVHIIEAENKAVAYAEAVDKYKYSEYPKIAINANEGLFGAVIEVHDNPNHRKGKSVPKSKLATKQESRSGVSSVPASIKQSITSIQLPKIEFQDSGWILLYRIAGWLCVVVGVVVLIVGLASDAGSSTEEGFVFFCCALLAASANFFAAHILRLQEKTAAFTEVTAGIMEKHHELMVENVNLLRSIAQKTEDKG